MVCQMLYTLYLQRINVSPQTSNMIIPTDSTPPSDEAARQALSRQQLE